MDRTLEETSKTVKHVEGARIFQAREEEVRRSRGGHMLRVFKEQQGGNRWVVEGRAVEREGSSHVYGLQIVSKTVLTHYFLANRWRNNGNSEDFIFLGSKISADGDCSHGIKKMLAPWKKSYDQPSSVQFSRSIVSDSLRPHELQHARPPCPSPTPRVHSNSRPLSW